MYLTSLSQGDQEGCRGRLENASNATDAEKGRVTRAEATISFLEAAVVAGEEHSFSLVVEETCWDNGHAGARAGAGLHAAGKKAWHGTSSVSSVDRRGWSSAGMEEMRGKGQCGLLKSAGRFSLAVTRTSPRVA